MRAALVVMGGLVGAVTLYLIVYTDPRANIGLIIAGASLALGCLMMLAAGEDET